MTSEPVDPMLVVTARAGRARAEAVGLDTATEHDLALIEHELRLLRTDHRSIIERADVVLEQVKATRERIARRTTTGRN